MCHMSHYQFQQYMCHTINSDYICHVTMIFSFSCTLTMAMVIWMGAKRNKLGTGTVLQNTICGCDLVIIIIRRSRFGDFILDNML